MQHHARVFMRNTFNPCRLMLDVLYMMSHAHFKTEISQLCICVCRIWIWSTKRHNPSTIFSFPVYLSVILKEWDSQALLHLEAETWLLLLVNSGTDKTLQPVIKMKRVYAKKKKERKKKPLSDISCFIHTMRQSNETLDDTQPSHVYGSQLYKIWLNIPSWLFAVYS